MSNPLIPENSWSKSIKPARWSMSAAADRSFINLTRITALIVLAVVIALLIAMLFNSHLSISKFGINFIFTRNWDPVKGEFGALPFIFGTIITALIALIISVPVSLAVAIFLNEQCPRRLRTLVSSLVELLAAIPSVAYGLWGIFVLVPIMRNYVDPFLAKYLGFLPIFHGPFFGLGTLTAGIILAVMIVPIITSISNSAIASVSPIQREAALALGATRLEATWIVLLNARSGIIGGVILGLGRALGETMAVTMVIGNRPDISASLFAPAYTMASVIANEFTEATEDLYLHALIEIGILLFVVTFLVQAMAQLLIWRVTRTGQR